MKIEKGVMIIKDGKAWGIEYADGHSTSYGWVDIESYDVHVRDPRYCRKIEDATYENSPYLDEMKKGKLMHVEKRIEVTILGEYEED